MRPSVPGATAVAFALVITAAMACSRAEPAGSRPAAPTSLRGTVVMEPPRIGIGETATVEVAVITPPGHRVAPVRTPEHLEGFSILGVEAPGIERSASRWVHRTRFRIRARETGSFAWPGQRLEVETPDGARSSVEIEERPLRVEEVSKEFPDRQIFFPIRTPRAEGWARGLLLPAAAGALLALSGVALVALARRVRSRSAGAADGSSGAEVATPWRITQAALATASELVRNDPCRAADMASGALRLYLSRRFHTPASTRTTEELEAMEPPFALASRWPELLALLRTLDGVRFRPGEESAEAGGRERAAAAIRAAQALVSEMAPAGGAS